jgi:hypothetical protein
MIEEKESWITRHKSKIAWAIFAILMISYNLWKDFWFADFYIGNAVSIVLFTLILKLENKNSFIFYLIFCGAMNNLVDELFFDNTKIGINEYISLICVPVIWYLKKE